MAIIKKGKKLNYGQMIKIKEKTGIDMSKLLGDLGHYFSSEEKNNEELMEITRKYFFKDIHTMPNFLMFCLGIEKEEVLEMDQEEMMAKMIEGLVSVLPSTKI